MSYCYARNHDYDARIAAAAASWSIDPALLKAHVNRESAFDPNAYRAEPNVADASYGLAQVRYKIAKSLGYPGTPDGLYEPGTNLYLAAKLIRQNLDYSGGDLATAVSAYNAGFGNPPVRTGRRSSDGRFINQGYVDDVLGCLAPYRADFPTDATPDTTPPATTPPATSSSTGLSSTLLLSGAALIAGFIALLFLLLRGRPS
jgi:soluble lytic murein transglycosylase-like protein